jgi:hypothetical protein
MRVAVIERFSDPSRNCDPDRVGGPGDDIRFVRLSSGGRFSHLSPGVDQSIASDTTNASLPWRCIRSLCGILADGGLTSHDKRRLITSALTTGGAPFVALAGAYTMRFDFYGQSLSIESTVSRAATFLWCRF